MITVTLTGKIVAVMAIVAIICLGAVFVYYKNLTNQILVHQDREIKRLKKAFGDLSNARLETRKYTEKMTKLAKESNELNGRLIKRIEELEKENNALKSEIQARQTEDFIY